MPTVKLPDGTRLNFPDGMSEEEMASAIDANFPQFASPKTQPKQPDALDQEMLKYRDGKPAPERSWSEAFGDSARSLTQGFLDIASVPGVAYGAATGNYDNALLRTTRGINEVIDDQMSPAMQARRQELARKQAAAEGWQEKLGVGLVETISDPALLANTALRSLPGMGASGVAGRVAGGVAGRMAGTTATVAPSVAGKVTQGYTVSSAAPQVAARVGGATAVGTGAVQQGASVAADTYDEAMKIPLDLLRQDPEFQTLAEQVGEEEAQQRMAADAANRAGAVATAASLAAMKMVPGGSTIEKAFLPAAMRETAEAGSTFLTRPLTKGMAGGFGSKAAELAVVGGAKGAQESLSEGFEEGAGAAAKALEMSRLGKDVNVEEEAAAAAGQAMPVGFALGGGVQTVQTLRAPRVEEQPTVPVAPPVTPAVTDPRSVAQKIKEAEGGSTDTGAAPAAADPAAQARADSRLAAVDAALAEQAAVPGAAQPTANVPAAPVAQALTQPENPLMREIAAIRQRAADRAAIAQAPTPTPDVTPQTLDMLVSATQGPQARGANVSDPNVYSDSVLYGIINHPNVGQEMLGLARAELARRRGTIQAPNVSTNTSITGIPGSTGTRVDGAQGQSNPSIQPGPTPTITQEGGGGRGLAAGAPALGNQTPAGAGGQGSAPVLSNRQDGGAGRFTPVLAPAAPKALAEAQLLTLRNQNGIQAQVSQRPLTEEQQLTSHFVNTLGKTVTWVEGVGGKSIPDGWVNQIGGKHIFLDINGTKPLVETVLHEGTHALPDRIRIKLARFVLQRTAPEGQDAFLAKYDYEKLSPKNQAEEVLAYVAQQVGRRPEFIQDLKTALGNKDFAEFARVLINKMREWLGRGDSQFDREFLGKYVTDVQGIHNELVKAYAEAMREQGLEPDAGVTAPMFAQKRTSSTEKVGDLEVTPVKDGSLFVHGDPETIRQRMPEGVKGRVESGGVRFTHSDAPRVRGALQGNQIAYSRAGVVTDKLPMKDGKYVGAPEKFNTPGKIPTLRKWLRQLADEGAPGRYWYENSSRAILQMTGGDVNEARKFVALLAIYSPQAKVDANSTFALRAWAQYKMGQPISVKTGVMDAKARAALDNVDAFWSGEKTGNFFHNLLSEIDPTTKGKQGATIDMWMMRAGQYSSDEPTATQYAFMENETNRLAQELGWEPQQVQAAIWVAVKARMENKGVKERTEAISEKKGWMRWASNAKGQKVRDVLDQQAHRDNWLKQAFAHDPTTDDTQQAKFDFSDGVRRHIGQVSWEARPGRSTGVLPGVNDAPYDQQVEFQQAIQKALLGPNGEDLLAQQLGLLVDGEDLLAPGVWQGEIAAGMQKQVPMAPAKGDDGKTALDPTQKQALDIYSAVLGMLLRQEGVGWHRPFYKANASDANGVELRIGNAFTPEQARELWQALDTAFKAEGASDWENGAGMISSPEGMRVVNFGALDDNLAFQRLVKSAASGLSFDTSFGRFASDGNLVTNNWKENPNGDSYRSRIVAAGRSDLLGWAGSVLAPRVQRVFEDFSERYGWGDPGQPVFSNKSAPDGLGGVYGERGQGTDPHAVNVVGTHFSREPRSSLDGRYNGSGLKGAESSRLAQATDSRIKERVYFYVNEGKGLTPEAGVGGYAHTANLSNLYNAQGDPRKLFRANDLNGSESRVLDAGYDGYYFPNYVNGQGIAVVMGNASRGIAVQQADYQRGTAPAAPVQPYKRGLTSKELNTIDLGAVQAVAPSAKLRAGTFQVDQSEFSAARSELAKQGIDLPDAAQAFSNKAQDLDQDIVLTFPVEGGKTAKMTVNAKTYLDQLSKREDALRMVKECLA